LALEVLQQTTVESTYCHLSLEVVGGTQTPNIVHIRGMVGNQQMILLIVSGSSNTFMNKLFAEPARRLISPAPVVSVKVANGELMISDS
jgi:hypothetical protein